MSEVIDDKWAAVWPRRWVMVRDADSDPWKGPYRLLGRAVYCSWEYVTDRGPFGQCRPATPEEIATVEPAAASTELPDPGPGWRIAGGDDWRDERCEVWSTVFNGWTSRRTAAGSPFDGTAVYRIPDDQPQPEPVAAVETAEAEPSPDITPQQAIAALSKAMQEDSDFAWTWHSNIAMVAWDAGAPICEANERAADFIKHVFGVAVRASEQWKNMPMPPATPEEIATVEPVKETTVEPKPSDEMARYLELKRLAESVIGSVLIAQPENMCHQSAIAAWDVAEAMYAESERRRPKQ